MTEQLIDDGIDFPDTDRTSATAGEPPEEPNQIVAELKAELEVLDVGSFLPNDETADLYRYVRRRTQLEAEIARIESATKAMVKSLTARIDGLDYLCRARSSELVARMIEGRKQRSVKTPFGVAGFRKTPARIDVFDEQLFLIAAQKDDDLASLVRVKKEPDRTAIKEYVEKTGELPPGVDLVAEQDKFYVK